MAKNRRTFTQEQKVKILKEHLLDHKPVSDICDAYHLQPILFYQRQKQFFKQGNLVFHFLIFWRVSRICGIIGHDKLP
ncbi:MAG: transposase [Candidatus Zhuqueibacterota bacterium]